MKDTKLMDSNEILDESFYEGMDENEQEFYPLQEAIQYLDEEIKKMWIEKYGDLFWCLVASIK